MKMILVALVAIGLAGCNIEGRWVRNGATETIELPGGGRQVNTALADGRIRVIIYGKDGNIIKDHVEPGPAFAAAPPAPRVEAESPRVVVARVAQSYEPRVSRSSDHEGDGDRRREHKGRVDDHTKQCGPGQQLVRNVRCERMDGFKRCYHECR